VKNILLGFLLLLFSINGILSQNLIVDKNSINQYDHDNYVYFNSYNFDGDFQGNHVNNPPLPDPTDRINLPETFPILGNQFTIELWVYSEESTLMNNRTFIGNDANPANNDFNRPPMITFNLTHQIGVGFGTGSAGMRKKANYAMTDDQWYHIAWSFDGTISNLYVDGELIESSDFAAGAIPVQVPISIIGRKFIGKIDEVRIWDLVRDQEQIQAVMNTSLSGDESGLIAYYPMEVNEDWKLIDYSSNENHASIVDAEILQKYSSQNCASPDGSSLCPFPTIRDALDVAQEGDNILIAEGRYSEVLFDEEVNYTDGVEGSKISITGENDNVKLDGTIELNADWEFSNGVYTAQVDLFDISKRAGIKVEDIYGLWVDDRYMIPAMPINFSNPTDPTTSNQNNPESGTVFDLNLTTPYYQPGESTLELQDPYIVGDINNLDGLEEWSFDKENNVLYLIAGDNIPNDTNVRVRIRTKILSLEYSDNLEFKNIDFFAGTFLFHGSSFILFEDLKFSHSWEVGMSYISAGNPNYDRGNKFWGGTNNTIRNCIFEYINDARAMHWASSMYPLGENILFQYNDWFKNTVWAPSASDNFRGGDKWYSPGVTIGGSTFRHITMNQNHTGGLQPGLQSLVEYARIENQYINIDGSGIQRTTGNTVGSTTRYSWLLNTNRNGMRFDSQCAGTDGVVHNVVSAGNKIAYRLKGDRHRAFHIIGYDTNRNDISMPRNKFCGDDWENNDGVNSENMLGNLNSRLLNSIAEKSMGANTPDAGDPSITGGDGQLIAENISNEFLLNESGIWFGRALDEDHAAPFIYPHLELQDPWFENRTRSVESLESQFGENPYTDANQDYDFRPRKGSTLLDGGVVIPGINDGQDDDSTYPLNHPPSYTGQHRPFIGDAPDIGPYEYGDSVYWIPGFRYSYPTVPIPSDGAVDVPIDYSVIFNYPWKTDYSNTTAIVNITGPCVNRTETLNYPENVVFQTFLPGETYTWTVTVDGVSSDNWTFTVSDKIHPLNDRSVHESVVTDVVPTHNKSLDVAEDVVSFLRFDIPSSVDLGGTINLNITPEQIENLDGGIVLYKYNYQGWGEKFNDNNLGSIDRTLLTTLDTISSLESGSQLSIDVSEHIDSAGEYSFALGALTETDQVSFYSKEKHITDGIDIYVEAGDLLGPSGNGSGYAPMIEVWPSLSFEAAAPVITLTGDNPITIEVGDSFTDPGATATDNYETTITVTGSVDVNTLGAYTITYSAEACSGNTASSTRTVNVVDTTAPVITLTGDNPITIEVGDSFTDPGATATDNYDSAVTVTTTGSVDVNTVGSYTITYSAEDSSGNTATTATRTVNVVDTTAPNVVCQNISIELSSNEAVSISADDINNGSNDYSGISEVSIDQSTFDCSNLGDNQVVLSVTDNYGNIGQCTGIVTVIDVVDPVIACNNITITLENMFAEISIEDIDNGSSDNCGISDIQISQTQFTDEHVGENIISLTVTDNYGNISSCDAIVTVDAGLGIDDNTLANISLYPNPSSDLVFIEGANTELEAVVFDLLGKQVMREFITDKLDISCLEQGTYIINLTDGINTSSHKIIKN